MASPGVDARPSLPSRPGVSAAPASTHPTPPPASPSSVTALPSPPGAGVRSCCRLHRAQLATTPAKASPSAHGRHRAARLVLRHPAPDSDGRVVAEAHRTPDARRAPGSERDAEGEAEGSAGARAAPAMTACSSAPARYSPASSAVPPASLLVGHLDHTDGRTACAPRGRDGGQGRGGHPVLPRDP